MRGRLPRGGVDRNFARKSAGRLRNVASPAEAWIETFDQPCRAIRVGSPPPRRRGSKPRRHPAKAATLPSPPPRRRGSKRADRMRADAVPRRLPRGGVDRNLPRFAAIIPKGGRLPRGGVDRNSTTGLVAKSGQKSPPPRRRGSKPANPSRSHLRLHVASPAEAWIETSPMVFKKATAASPPPRRRGSKHVGCIAKWIASRVASPAEAWIETAQQG